MPMYEYQCACGRRFDELVPHGRADRVVCACGRKARRLVSCFRTERRFAGTESMSITEGCHPLEVDANRKLFGDSVTIDNKGDYFFKDRGQQKRYRKRKESIKKAEAALQRSARPLPRGLTTM